MQDIVPRKTIRDIEKNKVVQGASKDEVIVTRGIPQHTKNQSVRTPIGEEYIHSLNQTSKGNTVWKYFLILFVCASVGVIGYLHATKEVTVFITPHMVSVSFQNELLEIPAEEIDSFQDTKQMTIPLVSTGSKNVETKAKGIVTIFNTGSQTQLLIASTRLSTPANIVYRLDGRITVPAAKNGKPGSIEAFVTANGSGAMYNTKIGDLTFPGLSGSPRFKQVYARISKGITGGDSENVPVFEQSVVDNVIKEAIVNIKKDIEQKIQIQSSSTSRSIGDIVWDVEQKIEKTSAQVIVTGTQISIHENKLATYIAREKQIRTMDSVAVFANIKVMNLQIQERSNKNIRVRATIDAQLQAFIRIEDLQKQLEGKTFAQFTPIMKTVTGAKESNFTSKPFWIQSFPSADRIEVQIK